MPQSPYAKLRASINGAGVQTGGITVPASATVQLSADPTASVGVTQYKYEIYGYPVGFTVPSGWSTDSAGVYFYNGGATPPVFTLPAISLWGKFMLRLTVNNAVSTNPVVIPVSQLVDNSTALSMLSANGLADVGLFESNQFSSTWVPPVQAALRAADTATTLVGTPVAHGSLQPSDGIHGIIRGSFATSTARTTATYTALDVGGVFLQTDTDPPTLWYAYKVVSGVASFLQFTMGGAAFNGDFAALAASYGLTVRADFRGDMGLSGTTGTGKSVWANQTGDFGNMSPGTGTSNGIGTPGAGLNGKASMIADGSTQAGKYTSPSASAPATVNSHIWAISRFIVTPVAQGTLHGNAFNEVLYMQASQVSPACNVKLSNFAVTGATTTGVVSGQWYRVRASLVGGTNTDALRVGAHAPALGTTSNTAPGLAWGWSADSNGSFLLQQETLRLMHIEGTMANFLAFAADADAKAQTWWTSAIEI